MSALILPRRFKTQPQYAAPLDLSGLGRNVIGGCVPGIVSLKGRGVSTRIGQTGYNKFGLGTFGGNNNYATAVQAVQLAGRSSGGTAESNAHTLLFVFSGVGNNSFIYDGQSDSDSTVIKKDSSGNLQAVFGTSSSLFSSVPIPSGDVVLIITNGIYLVTNAVAWVNGAKYTSSTYTDSWLNTAKYSAFFGSSAFPTANIFSGVGNLAVVFRGLVSDAEAQELTANPWQIFKAPARRLWAVTETPPVSSPIPVFINHYRNQGIM